MYKKIFKIAFISSLVCFVLIVAVNIVIVFSGLKNLQTSEEVDPAQAVLVLGARVYSSGKLSPMLEDRVLTALELYAAGKAEKLLVSGDHGTSQYDEVNAMKEYLLERGVPAEDIFLDHAGFDTYDSLIRAKEVFQADSLIVVTQNFHLPRAVYIGDALNMRVAGISADRQPYQGIAYNHLREFPARIKSFLEVVIKKDPRFLGDPIAITGDGRESWD